VRWPRGQRSFDLTGSSSTSPLAPLRCGFAVALVTCATSLGCHFSEPELPAPRHLVLITVDTLRADRLGAYGYAEANTPAIDALARESLRFERAYAHASATVPSMASLFTGRLPARTGVVNNAGRIPAGVPTLTERLRADGFDTAAFIGNWALRRGRGFERAFETYTRSFAGREAVRLHPENPGQRLTDLAADWLAKRDAARRFFLWVHYQEPHGPYQPPGFETQGDATEGRVLTRSGSNSGRGAIPDYQWLGHGRLDEYLARYDGEVSEADYQVGRLLDALRERELLDATLLIFTADHGEAFGEEDLFLAHGEGLGEVLVRVPLLLRLPGRRAGVRSDAVRLIDVAPTALTLLGVGAADLPGMSLFAEEGDRITAAQMEPIRGTRRWRSVRDGRFELRESGAGMLELRDLERGGTPLAHGEEAEVRSRLGAALRELAPWAENRSAPDLTDEDRQGLRALGYLD
jgi:arylsulfatase